MNVSTRPLLAVFSLSVFSLVLSVPSFAGKMPASEPGTYEVDPAHTRVQFVVPHFVISKVEGRFNEVAGKVVIAKDWKDAQFEATIQTKSIDTAVAKRDDHLRSPDFFDAAQFPTMTFKSTKIRADGDDLKIEGDLTIKGVKKHVTLKGEYKGGLNDPWGNHRIALKGETKINRKDYKINYNDKIDIGPTVGDEVEIKIIVEAIKPIAKK